MYKVYLLLINVIQAIDNPVENSTAEYLSENNSKDLEGRTTRNLIMLWVIFGFVLAMVVPMGFYLLFVQDREIITDEISDPGI